MKKQLVLSMLAAAALASWSIQASAQNIAIVNGKAVPNSGGDYALFRPDDVLSFDARYMLQEDDGTLIMIYNKGYLWGRYSDTMVKIRQWIFEKGPVVPETDYYLRAFPTFEVEKGKHDWLMRHVIIGVGKRKEAGNIVRYYALV